MIGLLFFSLIKVIWSITVLDAALLLSFEETMYGTKGTKKHTHTHTNVMFAKQQVNLIKHESASQSGFV